MPIKAYIFDLDGTLLDSEILWCKAMQQLIFSRGLPVTDSYACELVFGRSWGDVLTRLRKDYPSITEAAWILEQESQQYYETLHATVDIRIHGSIDLLKRLAQKYPVAIVSGSTRRQIADAITLMDIHDYIQFYLGNEDYPRGKPDPSGFLLAAQHFGVEPEACLVFEDSSAGVRAAKAAGMHCVALHQKGHPPQDVSMADEILSDLAEFHLDL
jgi:HAD superfamily hydrolase (TIGR01509 family)